MSNNVQNYISYTGDEGRIREMLETIKNDTFGLGTIDFNKIIPMPESLDIELGSKMDRGLKAYREFVEGYIYGKNAKEAEKALQNIPKEKEEVFLKRHSAIPSSEWELGKIAWNNIRKYGYSTWYDWRYKYWNTKWNAYDYEKNVDYSTNAILHFFTDWNPPHPVIEKLAKMFPDISFEHKWADEDIGANCGISTYVNGKQTEFYCPDSDKESIDFACSVWGCEPNEF